MHAFNLLDYDGVCIHKHTQHTLFSLNNTPTLQQVQILLLITSQIKI